MAKISPKKFRGPIFRHIDKCHKNRWISTMILTYAIFRSPFEIFIGNYPVEFDENDVRNLFNENGVPVTTIRLKKNGQNV